MKKHLDENLLEILFFGTLLLILVLMTIVPRWNYFYPQNVDEWFHISVAKAYWLVPWDHFTSENFDPLHLGFHGFLFFVDGFVDLIKAYPYLITFNSIFLASALYFGFRRHLGVRVALFAVLFLMGIPSNMVILGIWFLVPMSFVLPWVVLLFVEMGEALPQSILRKRFFVYLVMIALIHQTTFALLLVPVSYFLKLKSARKVQWLFLLLITSAVAWICFNRGIIINRGTVFLEPLRLWERFNWSLPVDRRFLSPLSTLGLPFLFFVGVGLVAYQKIASRLLKLWLILFSLSFLNFLSFVLIGRSFLSNGLRSFYLCMIASVPFAALGLEMFLKQIEQRFRLSKIQFRMFSGTIVIFILGFNLANHGRPENFPHMIDQNDLAIFKTLKTYGNASPLLISNRARSGILSRWKDAEVLIPELPGTALYSMTGKRPSAGIYPYDPEGFRNNEIFFSASSDCRQKKEILNTNPGIHFVVSEGEIVCPFLKLVEASLPKRLYEVRL